MTLIGGGNTATCETCGTVYGLGELRTCPHDAQAWTHCVYCGGEREQDSWNVLFCARHQTRCERCGTWYGIGESVVCRDGHGTVQEYHPFKPRFDIALGKQTNTLADRWRFMREKKLDYAPEKMGEPGVEF